MYARKAVSRTSDPRIIDQINDDAENIYLKALIGIIAKLMCKGIFLEVYKRCGECVNAEPVQQSHDYCLLVDPATKPTECFDSVFSKVDIYLVNELCFEKVQDLFPIPVRDIGLNESRETFRKSELEEWATFKVYWSWYIDYVS